MNINQYIKKGSVNLKHFLSLDGVTENDIAEIIISAREFKNMRAVHENSTALKGQYVLLVTKQNNPRANITFQIAIKELSGEPIITSLMGEHLESLLEDANYVKALSACGLSAILVCTSKSSDSKAFFDSSSVPVIDATMGRNPVEALAALMTVSELTPNFKGLKFTIVGDLSQGDYSFITALLKFDADVTLYTTKDGSLPEQASRYLSQFAELKITHDKESAIKGADYIYFTDGDGSLFIDGDDLSINENVKILSSVPVSSKLANSSVYESENSLISKQNENLLHTCKALLYLLSNKKA